MRILPTTAIVALLLGVIAASMMSVDSRRFGSPSIFTAPAVAVSQVLR
jgi:hypothetical protein